MLIALDSGLDQTMVVIGLKAFSPALVGGLDSLVGALVGSLIVAGAEVLAIHYVDPLLSDVVPFLVLIAMLIVRPWGLFGTRRSSTVSRQPRASGYFRTDYAQDLALTGTRLERVALPVRGRAARVPARRLAFQLDLACQVSPRLRRRSA